MLNGALCAEPLKLLFVCTANISRSPYAERRARMLLGGAPFTVASAGVPGLPGRHMDPGMAGQLELRGENPLGHLSRSLNDDILSDMDIVLTFETVHDHRIMEHWPQAAARTFGLKQFAEAVSKFDAASLTGEQLVARAREVAGVNSMGWDVEDPYGRGRRAAAAAAEEIDRATITIVRRLFGLKPSGPGPQRAQPPVRAKWPSLGRGQN